MAAAIGGEPVADVGDEGFVTGGGPVSAAGDECVATAGGPVSAAGGEGTVTEPTAIAPPPPIDGPPGRGLVAPSATGIVLPVGGSPGAPSTVTGHPAGPGPADPGITEVHPTAGGEGDLRAAAAGARRPTAASSGGRRRRRSRMSPVPPRPTDVFEIADDAQGRVAYHDPPPPLATSSIRQRSVPSPNPAPAMPPSPIQRLVTGWVAMGILATALVIVFLIGMRLTG